MWMPGCEQQSPGCVAATQPLGGFPGATPSSEVAQNVTAGVAALCAQWGFN